MRVRICVGYSPPRAPLVLASSSSSTTTAFPFRTRTVSYHFTSGALYYGIWLMLWLSLFSSYDNACLERYVADLGPVENASQFNHSLGKVNRPLF